MSDFDDEFRSVIKGFEKYKSLDEFIAGKEREIVDTKEDGDQKVDVEEYRDVVNDSVHFELSDGSFCRVPLKYFEAMEKIKEEYSCRTCGGALHFFFDFDSPHILLLRCNKCRTKFTFLGEGLCFLA